MRASNKAITNVLILYGKAVLTGGIVLLSTRWVLEALGEEDYGIYNLVGGIIAMFSFLNVAMVAASQRFLSYAIGQKHNELIKETFKVSVILHVIIGIGIIFLFEILGQYLMFHHLNIPKYKLNDAIQVLHYLSITAFFTVITVPYQSVLNAHENMMAIALIGIFESLGKFLIALCLLHLSGSKLILYSIMVMGLTILSTLILRLYCHRKYIEVKGNPFSIKSFSLFRKMFSFAGWNFIGSISSLLRNQGLAMLMNSFFGVGVNASYGISTQVNGQAQFFSRTIIRALQPQIVKSEGACNRNRMISLAMTTCKIPFIILSFVVIPLIAQMKYIVGWWLTEVPEYTIIFCQLILAITLISQLKMGISIAIDSVGNIKWYQIICGGLHFIVLPLAYLLFKLGFNPTLGLIVVFVEEGCVVFLTSIIANKLVGLNLHRYLVKVLIPCCICVIISYIIAEVSSCFLKDPIAKILLFILIYIGVVSKLSYNLVMNCSERNNIKNFLNSLFNKIFSSGKKSYDSNS